jgi:RNA polymerase sigma-70 factor (ECF subfamily)
MEENLIKLAKQKDKLAFDKIIEKYSKDLYVIAKSRLKEEADIEDAIQQTLFDIYKKIWYLNDENSFKTWIVRILINNCNDILRKNKELVLCFEDGFGDRIEDSEDYFFDLEEDYDFFELIDFLDPDDKAMVIMRYSKDYNIGQISKALKMREGTIRMRLLRSREKLKEKFEDKF